MSAALESPPMGQELDREKMRALRKEKGLSQGDAAEAAGMNGGASQWSDVENGRKANVTLDTLSRIAAALGCDSRDLILPPDPPQKKKAKKS